MQNAVGAFSQKSAGGHGRDKLQGRLQMRGSAVEELLDQSAPEGKGKDDNRKLSLLLQLAVAGTSSNRQQVFLEALFNS